MSRIPESAAVNATVNTLKAAGQPGWLVGFVNGLLRAVARERATLPSPEVLAAAEPPLLDHPDWLVACWRARHGDVLAREICRCNNTEPPLTLRTNTRRTGRALLRARLAQSGIVVENGRYSPAALVVPAFPGAVTALPGYAEGLFQVQDEAAQLGQPAVTPLPARCRVLDGCAGVGGKTSHLAELLPTGGTLVAVEPDRRRYGLLRENLARLGLGGSVDALRTDLAQFAATRPAPFDAILIDAPCSGTGVIRRHPDIRWNRQPEDLATHRQDQLQLLAIAARLLKPGGVLVYATCSLEPEENEEVVVDFLAHHPDFGLEPAAPCCPNLPGAWWTPPAASTPPRSTAWTVSLPPASVTAPLVVCPDNVYSRPSTVRLPLIPQEKPPMAGIKSTMDLVMERAARMGIATPDEIRREEDQKTGMQLTAAYLNGQQASLAAVLAEQDGARREPVRRGMLESLLRNVFLPREEDGRGASAGPCRASSNSTRTPLTSPRSARRCRPSPASTASTAPSCTTSSRSRCACRSSSCSPARA